MNILNQRQAYDLDLKIMFTKQRIEEFYTKMHGNVYISFSGGKDSTVLLDIARSIYPDIPAVFIDTGLEYPEVKEFVKTIDNVICIKPKMRFDKVIEKYGYPVISKETAQKIYEIRNTNSEKLRNKRLYGDNKGNGKISEKWKTLIDSPFKIHSACCNIMKKYPAHQYEKLTNRKPILGTMASDSRLRRTAYEKSGCNSFNPGKEKSIPLGFWLEKDIWEYLKKFNVPYSEIYNMGYSRTGCMFCMFGTHLEGEPNRFQRMKITHPKQYNYCINKLGCGKVLDFINVKY